MVFLEPKRLYHLTREQVEDDGRPAALDQPVLLREGDDITFVTWGAATIEVMAAADALAEAGRKAEIIDLATLSPLDETLILASVEKTGRCVIVHEAARMCGVGAEIAAGLSDAGLYVLHAPVKRVTGYDSVMPLYKMEMKYMPSVERILDAVNEVMEVS